MPLKDFFNADFTVTAGQTPGYNDAIVFFNGQEDKSEWIKVSPGEGWGIRYVRKDGALVIENDFIKEEKVYGKFEVWIPNKWRGFGEG